MSVPTRREAHHAPDGRPVYDMPLPFNPNTLVQQAQTRGGMSVPDARIFAHLALAQMRKCHGESTQPVSALQVAEAIKEFARLEVAGAKVKTEENLDRPSNPENIEDESGQAQQRCLKRPPIKLETVNIDGLAVKKFTFEKRMLKTHFGGQDPYCRPSAFKVPVYHRSGGQVDIITRICNNVELAVELGAHLRPEDILNLYVASRAFNHAVSGYLFSSVRAWIARRCPEAGRIFPFKFYKKVLIPDPKGRTWQEHYPGKPRPMNPERAQQVRSIPGLKYVQLVLIRDRCCRQITAIMARNGHRLPDTMYSTLLRLWLLMETSTTSHRKAMLRNKAFWTDQHLYNAQLFFVKLGMHFNDPVFGPSSYELLHLIMGQRGLYPLWQLLMRKKFTKLPEILELKVRYDFKMPHDHWGHDLFDTNVHGVPFNDIGKGHCEGWGTIDKHLMRPDELVPYEAVLRGLALDDHIRHMVLWGYFDWKTGENLVPSESEMYISDEETTLSHMDTDHHWRKKHAAKKRWQVLTPNERQAIIDEDEDEQLRALAWTGYDEDDDDDMSMENFEGDETYNLNDEITRGFMVRPQSPNHKSTVPCLKDKVGWSNFVNKVMIGLAPEIDEDEALKAQAWVNWRSHTCHQPGVWEEWVKREKEDLSSGGTWNNTGDASDDVTDDDDSSPGWEDGGTTSIKEENVNMNDM